MIVHGRISVYGEYLMDCGSTGLMLRSRLFLASPDETEAPELPGYLPEADTVASLLVESGLPIVPGLRGDLWQGYGLASSTAASLIYLAAWPDDSPRDRMMHVDRVLHGFEPSGVDMECAMRQRDGLFGGGLWYDVIVRSPRRSLVMFPKEKRLALAQVRSRVQGARQVIAPLSEVLTATVRTTGLLSFDEMLKHARCLAGLKIYSEVVQTFIEWALDQGVVAK